MAITASNQGGVQVIEVGQDLVSATAKQFRQTVETLLSRDERDYVVDLGETMSVDSAGLEALTWLRRRSEERLGSVKLCNVSETIETILRITRLDGSFERFAGVEPAVASFG